MTFVQQQTILPRNASDKPIMDVLDFELPCELEAGEPPEARGLERDQVRLMVSYRHNDAIHHAQFRDIVDFLEKDDVLVINTSGTLNAALNAIRQHDQQVFEIHLSTQLPANLWIVEIRQPDGTTTRPYRDAQAGEIYQLASDGQIALLTQHNPDERHKHSQSRLWIATLDIQQELYSYLDRYGFPIRYSYVKEGWDNSFYQTVYADEPGSAEMPSAGRAFTQHLLERLKAKGVKIATLILHTGVASLEDHEPPYEEYYRVPSETAGIINQARSEGRRIVAVGTTVVRALETVTDKAGFTHAGEGWTRLIIMPERGIRSVNAMLTGLHEPKATHLAMLEALAKRDHLRKTYTDALDRGYLWHEFGDLHLILP